MEVFIIPNTLKHPRLETDRLVLELFKETDLPDVFAYASLPEITEFVSWDVHTSLADSKNFLDFVFKQSCSTKGRLFLPFAMRLKKTGRVIGSITYKNPDWWIGQIDYALSPLYWSQGLMTEAAAAVKKWALEMDTDVV